LLSNGRLKPLAVLNLETGASLSFVTYIRLSGIVSRALTLFVKNGQKSITLFNFFSGFKKGSKNLRKILQDKNNNQLQRVWHAFAEVARIADPDPVPDHFGKILSIWNLNCLPNSFRDFIFKFFHNRLGLNSRTANFLDHNNWCTFCSIVGLQMGPFDSETFLHFFANCPTVVRIHEDISSTLFEHFTIEKNHWLGLSGGNLFLTIVLLAIQFKIWEHKLINKLPSANYCLGEAIYLTNEAMKINKQINIDMTKLNCPISRLWSRLAQPRW
jgi:hypothetical protein